MEMDKDKQRFVITELSPDVTVDEVLEKTSAEVLVSSKIK
jgi:acyl CoA:acetate/3-ketoacid CoA transferase beta subunit